MQDNIVPHALSLTSELKFILLYALYNVTISLSFRKIVFHNL